MTTIAVRGLPFRLAEASWESQAEAAAKLFRKGWRTYTAAVDKSAKGGKDEEKVELKETVASVKGT